MSSLPPTGGFCKMHPKQLSLPKASPPASAFVVCLLVTCLGTVYGRVIDSIAGAVTDTFQCTFDTEWCGMEQEVHADFFDWSLESGNPPTVNSSYIYMESSRPDGQDNKARLKSPLLQGEGSRCLQFLWHVHGSGSQLTVKLQGLDGSERSVWSRSTSNASAWQVEQLNLNVSALGLYRLVFEGIVGSSHPSDGAMDSTAIVALDSIGVFTGRCPAMNCNFESDLCGWTNMDADIRKQWRRNQGRTPTPYTGPMADHNNNSMGYYLYVEASRTFRNDTAPLLSGIVPGSVAGYCLQFWYHMWGNDTGELNVLKVSSLDAARDPGQAQQSTELWSVRGSQGNVWHFHMIPITSQENFRLIFEVRLAGGLREFLGDIAIDDIVVLVGRCESASELLRSQTSASPSVSMLARAVGRRQRNKRHPGNTNLQRV